MPTVEASTQPLTEHRVREIVNAYLIIDGGTSYSIFGGSGSSAAAGNLQSTRRISTWLPTIFPLAPGGHSFTMAYAATGGTGNFSANYLKVQPL